MKKFAFTLEPVLDYRERIEEEKQLVFSARQREHEAAVAELDRLHGEFRANSARLRDRHKSFGAEELRAHYAHLEYLDRAITMQHGFVAQKKFAMDKAREDLLDASKDRKVMEKLKERRLDEYQRIEAVEDQKEVDDANNRRYAGPVR